MNEPDLPIEVFAHFSGVPEVSAPRGFKVSKLPSPTGPGLEPPEALLTMEAGELAEVQVKPYEGERPLVFASHGRKADLTSKREMIEAAHEANRKVEVHVFDELAG